MFCMQCFSSVYFWGCPTSGKGRNAVVQQIGTSGVTSLYYEPRYPSLHPRGSASINAFIIILT